jgi:hypothetical protein
MALKPSTAKIVDLDTTVDVVPVQSQEGPIVWATVKMEYTLAGLKPVVTICVPVPWKADQSQDERRGQALSCARQLIEHACRAAGVGPAEPILDDSDLGDLREDGARPMLEGLAKELGLSKPTRRPPQTRS